MAIDKLEKTLRLYEHYAAFPNPAKEGVLREFLGKARNMVEEMSSLERAVFNKAREEFLAGHLVLYMLLKERGYCGQPFAEVAAQYPNPHIFHPEHGRKNSEKRLKANLTRKGNPFDALETMARCDLPRMRVRRERVMMPSDYRQRVSAYRNLLDTLRQQESYVQARDI